MTTKVILDPAVAAGAVQAYNRGMYRGRRNVDVDNDGYERFRGGLSSDSPELIEQLRFIGEDYGGAQRRFIPHSIRDEAAIIAERVPQDVDAFNALARESPPLEACAPRADAIAYFFAPFVATKRWGVWASKTLHFLSPATFPVLDSRAKKALGIGSLGSSAEDYYRFCQLFRETLVKNTEAIAVARSFDSGSSPSDVKLLDKILYEIGR